jgi:hypothetical protein
MLNLSFLFVGILLEGWSFELVSVFQTSRLGMSSFLFPVLHDLAETQSFVRLMVLASATNAEIPIVDFVSPS